MDSSIDAKVTIGMQEGKEVATTKTRIETGPYNSSDNCIFEVAKQLPAKQGLKPFALLIVRPIGKNVEKQLPAK